MDWREVAENFAGDGALRDIYIFDTSAREWQAVYDAIRKAYPVVLHVKAERSTPPDSRTAAIAQQPRNDSQSAASSDAFDCR